MHATCIASLIHIDLITLIMFGEQCKLRSLKVFDDGALKYARKITHNAPSSGTLRLRLCNTYGPGIYPIFRKSESVKIKYCHCPQVLFRAFQCCSCPGLRLAKPGGPRAQQIFFLSSSPLF
jgi:hypothetical protein